MRDIDVLILAGGLGTRLRAAIGENQKVMAEVEGEPFLKKIVDDLKKQGFRRFILCTGYQAATVEQYFSHYDEAVITIEFSEEKEPLGTGGAIKQAKALIHSDSFLVLNGDSFCKLDLKAFVEFHRSKKSMVTFALVAPEEGKDYGQVILDEDQKICGFEEKVESKQGSFVNAGMYCFQKECLAQMPAQQKFALEYDCFPHWVEKNMYGFVIDRRFFDIGTPERYKKVQKIWKEHDGA